MTKRDFGEGTPMHVAQRDYAAQAHADIVRELKVAYEGLCNRYGDASDILVEQTAAEVLGLERRIVSGVAEQHAMATINSHSISEALKFLATHPLPGAVEFMSLELSDGEGVDAKAWDLLEELTSAQQLDINYAKAVNGVDGGAHVPTEFIFEGVGATMSHKFEEARLYAEANGVEKMALERNPLTGEFMLALRMRGQDPGVIPYTSSISLEKMHSEVHRSVDSMATAMLLEMKRIIAKSCAHWKQSQGDGSAVVSPELQGYRFA